MRRKWSNLRIIGRCYLQVQPKAVSSKCLCWATGAEGEKIQTLPRGFYLRPGFTAQLFSDAV